MQINDSHKRPTDKLIRYNRIVRGQGSKSRFFELCKTRKAKWSGQCDTIISVEFMAN